MHEMGMSKLSKGQEKDKEHCMQWIACNIQSVVDDDL